MQWLDWRVYGYGGLSGAPCLSFMPCLLTALAVFTIGYMQCIAWRNEFMSLDH